MKNFCGLAAEKMFVPVKLKLALLPDVVTTLVDTHVHWALGNARLVVLRR